jgi:hypothetical protein
MIKNTLWTSCDLILYLQKYVGNLENILSTITSPLKTILTYLIVYIVEKK